MHGDDLYTLHGFQYMDKKQKNWMNLSVLGGHSNQIATDLLIPGMFRVRRRYFIVIKERKVIKSGGLRWPMSSDVFLQIYKQQ